MTSDPGDDNPFVVTSSKDNYFTLYVVPASMEESKIAKLPSKNVRKVSDGLLFASGIILERMLTE